MSFMDRDELSGIAQREQRRARLVRGSMRLANGTVMPILVRNLSERGLGVACKTRPPARGDAVTITLPGSPELKGVVRWVREYNMGIALDATVDTNSLADAIRNEIARAKGAGEWQVNSRHRVAAPRTGTKRAI